MKNIYAPPYIISFIGLCIQTFLFVFGVMSDFSPLTVIILGVLCIITAIIHGSIGERYEQLKKHIKTLKMLKNFGEFMEKLSEEIEGDESDEKKS